LLGLAGLFGFGYYVVFFPFIHGSNSKADPEYSKFVIKVCGYEQGGFFWTLATANYVKYAFRRMFRFYYLKMFPGIVAQEGQKAPDGEIYTLRGEKRSLVKDYLSQLPPDMPIVLNFGSYT